MKVAAIVVIEIIVMVWGKLRTAVLMMIGSSSILEVQQLAALILLFGTTTIDDGCVVIVARLLTGYNCAVISDRIQADCGVARGRCQTRPVQRKSHTTNGAFVVVG